MGAIKTGRTTRAVNGTGDSVMDARKHGTNEKLTFSNLSGHYGNIPNGYGGFNWLGDVMYLNTMRFNTAWCDTGYNNVAAAAHTNVVGVMYFGGTAESANPTESFDLKSMIAASAWCTNQEWRFSTYTYSNGSFQLKGTENFYLRQSAQTLHFGKMGRNIAAVSVYMMNLGSAGNTCSYGSGTYGYQMVFDNMKVHWNGKIPGRDGNGHLVSLPHHMPQHHAMVAARSHNANAHASGAAHGAHAASHEAGGYHSELLGFGHDPGGLTGQFSLPQIDHFGT